MTNSVRIKQEMLDSSPEDSQGEQVLDLRKSSTEKSCNWCGKKGEFLDKVAHEDFCSEVCFDQYRRDSFKKRSACVWCSSTAAQQNVILSASNVDESKFCSAQCLAQFKVRVFCEETSAHLDQLKVCTKQELNLTEGLSDLITPELWLKKTSNGASKRLLAVASPSPQDDTTSDSLKSTNSGNSGLSSSNNGIMAALLGSSVVGTRPLSGHTRSDSSSASSKGNNGNSAFSVTRTTTVPAESPPYFSSSAAGTTTTATTGPPRKRGRIASSASSTVTSHHHHNLKSPTDTTTAATNSSSSFSHSRTNNNHSPTLAARSSERESNRSNSKRFAGINSRGTSTSSSSTSAGGRQVHMTPTFPGIVSPLVNNAFQMPAFPLPPPQNHPHSHHLPNGRFHFDRVHHHMRPEFLPNTGGPPDTPSSIFSNFHHHQQQQQQQQQQQLLEKPLSTNARFLPSSNRFNVPCNSYPPISLIVPIPIPIPVPIPIPIPLFFGDKIIRSNSTKSDDKAEGKGGIGTATAAAAGKVDSSNGNSKNEPPGDNNGLSNGKNDKSPSLLLLQQQQGPNINNNNNNNNGGNRHPIKGGRIIDIEEND